MAAGQAFIDNKSQCEDVVSRLRIKAVDHLRACVGWCQCAQDTYIELSTVISRLIWTRYCARYPEVDDFDSAVRQHDDVSWFEIAVYNSLRMSEFKCRHDLPEYR